MGGRDGFANFDSSSIVTSTSEKTWSIRGTSFRRRDIILGGIAIFALIVVIILAIVLAVEVSNNSDDDDGTSAKSSQLSSGQMCQTLECLETAAFSKEYMDGTQNPCVDFYTYACGHYAERNPRTAFLDDVKEMKKIRSLNEDKIISELYSSVKRSDAGYERKMKTFLSACRNHYDKMELRGTPFIEHVVNKTPGWDLFGEFNATTFDLQESLKLVRVDFLTPAFFHMESSVDLQDLHKSILKFSAGGTILESKYYNTSDPLYDTAREDYQTYMYNLAYLITIDNTDISLNASRIHTFVSDAFEIEHILALYALSMDQNKVEHRVTLEQLTRDLNNTVDFTDHLKSFFQDQPHLITSQTEVIVVGEEVFVNLGKILSNYMATDEGKRKLHNYMMWQLLSQYSHELSWDYIFAKRKLNRDIFDFTDKGSGLQLCFDALSREMLDALSAIFVKQFIPLDIKAQGVQLMEIVKNEVLQAVDKFEWMIPQNRKAAKAKIVNSLYKVGYPDHMQDEEAMDRLYEGVTMTPDSHMQNILAMHNFTRKRMGKALADTDYFFQWRYFVWSPFMGYKNSLHEMIVTYGFLQKPIYFANGPSYWNYGGLASLMAEILLHSVDDFGSKWSPFDKKNYVLWWNQTTSESYNQLKSCAVNATKDLTFGPYKDVFGNDFNFTAKNRVKALEVHASLQLSSATGIRLMYQAYMKDRANEAMAPVLRNQTPAKLFFLAEAQMFCENRPPGLAAYRLNSLPASGPFQFPAKERVNSALKLVPEFHQAFGCPANTDALACPGLFP